MEEEKKETVTITGYTYQELMDSSPENPLYHEATDSHFYADDELKKLLEERMKQHNEKTDKGQTDTTEESGASTKD